MNFKLDEVDDINKLMAQLSNDYNKPKNYQQTLNNKDERLQEEQIHRNEINERINSMRNFKDQYIHQNNNIVNPYVSSNHHNELANQNKNEHQNHNQQQSNFKQDLRQNMNNKMDNFIFDNPGSHLPPLIHINEEHKLGDYNFGLDYKPLVQERSKLAYKEETNYRLTEYSPLSRSIYMPGKPTELSHLSNKSLTHSPRDVMNDRLSQIPSLSCNVTLKKPNQDNRNGNISADQEKKYFINPMPNFNDVNQQNENVVFTNLPVFTK
jgi:hypothetical protein